MLRSQPASVQPQATSATTMTARRVTARPRGSPWRRRCAEDRSRGAVPRPRPGRSIASTKRSWLARSKPSTANSGSMQSRQAGLDQECGKAGNRGDEDAGRERHQHEGRPGVERPAAAVVGIIDRPPNNIRCRRPAPPWRRRRRTWRDECGCGDVRGARRCHRPEMACRHRPDDSARCRRVAPPRQNASASENSASRRPVMTRPPRRRACAPRASTPPARGARRRDTSARTGRANRAW